MRHTISTSILVFHVSLLIISLQMIQCNHVHPMDDHHPDDDDDKGTELIEKTCKRTPHYDLCISSLESNPESSSADLRGLARIMVDLVLSAATETLEYIRSLLKQEPTDPELEKALAYCAELYIPVVKYSLPQAIDALTGGHFGFANYGISDAAKQANACNKNFSNSKDSPLADKNSLLNDLSEVAAAIVGILLKG